MMYKKVAVAMSVYKSDIAENIKLSIDSILGQSYSNLDVFIEVDGYISEDCVELLNLYSKLDNVFVNFNSENRGLATRLNSIIDKIIEIGEYTYIARMDADDIAFTERITEQVNFLDENSEVSVVGTDLIEISDSGEEIFHKKMYYDHHSISIAIIRKCPFSHPTVMFRENVFSKSYIRYKPELMNTQDYYLWVDLLSAGHIFANIPRPLLYYRVNDDFHSRRGWNKAMNDLRSRVYAFKKLDVLSFSNVLHTLMLFLLRISPSFVKSAAYKFLR
ncbi:glycosyl transferase [Vibrio sp. ZF57]|nr:glycosyl transferase [Vibrio sp. ZF57]